MKGNHVTAAMGGMLALALCAVVLVPFVALIVAGSPGEVIAGLGHPSVGPALWLSLWTSLLSLALIVACGTPLAWWLSRSGGSRWARGLEVALQLPVVVPPAVTGIALLLAFGRFGLLGGALSLAGISLPFTSAAVVTAQIVVAAPFFVLPATAAFREVDDDLLVVAQTLGASSRRAFFEVALPASRAGLGNAAALCWARALGEFGATLLFAGNLAGRTQTMPLAIYAALEVDLGIARALSVALAGIAIVGLITARLLVRRSGRGAR